MQVRVISVLLMVLATFCPGEGAVGQASSPMTKATWARLEAEMEAFQLYAACELLVPFAVWVDDQSLAGVAAQVGLHDLDGKLSESLNETVRRRFDEWGLLDRDRESAFGGSGQFQAFVDLRTGPQMQIRTEFSKRLRDDYGNSRFRTTWERVVPPPPQRYADAGPGAVEAGLLAAVDEFAAAYLRINARACQ